MKRFFLTLIALLWLGAPSARAQVVLATPVMGSTYNNPVLKRDFPDPTVLQDADGTFYAVATSEQVYKSKDLVNWTHVGWMWNKSRPQIIPDIAIGCIWAPDLNKIGDKYVCYFSESVWGGGSTASIGVAVADKPQGPYKPVGETGLLFSSGSIGVPNSIDPFYFEEDDGSKWLVWGSFNGIYIIELADDGLSLKEGAEKMKIGGNAFEGSYILKRGGYYYYFGSVGSCCEGAKSTYRTVVARSKSLHGPYVSKSGGKLVNDAYETLISGSDAFVGTGHNAEIITDKNGDTWILYHAYLKDQPDYGRVLMLDRVLWDRNGWPYVQGGVPSVLAGKPEF